MKNLGHYLYKYFWNIRNILCYLYQPLAILPRVPWCRRRRGRRGTWRRWNCPPGKNRSPSSAPSLLLLLTLRRQIKVRDTGFPTFWSIMGNRGVTIPLFTGSGSGSRITQKLKIRLWTWIQGRNHNASNPEVRSSDSHGSFIRINPYAFLQPNLILFRIPLFCLHQHINGKYAT